MKQSDQRIRNFLNHAEMEFYSESTLQETIRNAKISFYKGEAQSTLSSAEFLCQQSKYIHKRWWILQAIVLLMLWNLLGLTGHSNYLQRSMGVAAPLFAILILPELWKNRNSDATEVECTAYFSLRQVYAARIFLFALVDLLLLTSFSIAAVATGRLLLQDIMIEFFLPYLVTCCICFRCLYSPKIGSEYFAVFLCIVWSGIWTQVILHDQIYAAISLPIWYSMVALALFYLGFCIYKGQKNCREIWEVNPLWN